MGQTVDLAAGQNVDAGDGPLQVRLVGPAADGPDLVALLLDADGAVSGDDDFVFYNAPTHPSGCVDLAEGLLRVDPQRVPATVERVVVAAHHDGPAGLRGCSVVVTSATTSLTFTPPQLEGLPTALMVEVYRRNGGWRVRAVGQGWASGLGGLARDFGVVVDDGPATTPSRAGVPDNPGAGVTDVPDVVDPGDETMSRRRQTLALELAELEQQLLRARAALVETDERMLLQAVGYYQFQHPLDDVVTSKARLDDLRSRIKTAITKRTAVIGRSEWMVNGSLKEGQKLVRQFGDLMLRTYNIEADNCVRTVRAHTVDTAAKRLERTREAIAENGRTMGVRIGDDFHELRLEELQLTADHHLRVEQQKEEAREVRQQQREEAKAQDEFRRRRKDMLKEQSHYRGLLERSQRNGDPAGETEARERLAEIAERIEEVEEMAANTRVGHVYVISNVGAFGDRVVKIGMTRREDPMQRVFELGSASVPFRFDVHALVFSQDAVALETALHREFDDRRVNQVNRRREFFHVSLAEVRDALSRAGTNHLVEFHEFPEAPEWRQSRAGDTDARAGVDLHRHPA